MTMSSECRIPAVFELGVMYFKDIGSGVLLCEDREDGKGRVVDVDLLMCNPESPSPLSVWKNETAARPNEDCGDDIFLKSEESDDTRFIITECDAIAI